MGEVIAIAAGVIVAAIGVGVAWVSFRRKARLTSATIVSDAMEKFSADKDMQAAFYAIEYDEFLYGADFHGSIAERQVDKLLRHFADVAHKWDSGLVLKEDLRRVQYYSMRILRNDEVQRYLDFLRQWAKKQGVEHPFDVLVKLGELEPLSGE